jgi:hypothetical protein
MQFRNGNGATAMALIVEHVPASRLEPDVVVVVRFSLDFRDPNAVLEHEAIFEEGLLLEQEGRYRVRVTAGGATIMERYFSVFRATDYE